jgi:citrate lyase subunit beta / citryl-CoA lyase
MIARSYLFVPADRPERYAKALASGADAVIVDLEDAVAPDDKPEARKLLHDWLAGAPAPVIVRINGVDSAWFGEDVAICRHASVAGVMLPKAERVDDLARIASIAPGKRLVPLVETAVGLDRARELAAAPGVERLAFGSIDFQLDVSIDGDADELLYFRSHLVLASRLGGCLPPVDGVSTAIDDMRLLESDTEHARRLGFGAKLCIHPRQVAIVNRAFTPNDEAREWARRVIDAAERAGGAAVAVDGRMVDRPVLLRAQRILAQTGERGDEQSR